MFLQMASHRGFTDFEPSGLFLKEEEDMKLGKSCWRWGLGERSNPLNATYETLKE